MRAVGVRPAIIAYARTGLLVTPATRRGYSSAQLSAWETAVQDYSRRKAR